MIGLILMTASTAGLVSLLAAWAIRRLRHRAIIRNSMRADAYRYLCQHCTAPLRASHHPATLGPTGQVLRYYDPNGEFACAGTSIRHQPMPIIL